MSELRIFRSPWELLNTPTILIVEDSDEDFYTFTRAMRKLDFFELFPHSILRLEDGDTALDYLLRRGEYRELESEFNPILIILDLNLPGTDGREIVRNIKQSKDLQSTPTIILTTSNNAKDVEICYSSGANSYLLKPMGIHAMQATAKLIIDYWLRHSILPSDIAS
jgi:CheY-like chemotaxis protein